MIFTVVAEGLWICLDSGIVDFICVPDLPHFKITLQSNNQFYTYISIGFIMMLVFHIFENVGDSNGSSS